MNKTKRQKLTASVLTFVMLFQIIAGIFAPVNIFNLQKNEAHAGWFDIGYGYKKEIKVDHTKVAGDLTNFPMLVSFTDPLFKTMGNGGRVTDVNGYDIIFANAAGTQKLDHEIEKYDAATGQIIMWVKIPALSASTDTSIYIYYGNSSITTSQENKTGVWDDGGANSFKGVWHLKETGTGVAGDYKDSTQYAGNSTNTAGQPTLVTGFIGSGQSFNGTSQQISLSGSQTVTSATFSTWVYRSASEISYAGILFSRGTSTSGLDVYAATNDIGYHWNDVNASFMFDSGLNLPLNQWAYVVLTVTPTTATFYMGNDGAVTSATNTMTHTVSTIDALTVGRDIAAGSRYFTGSIDEARFSNVARSSQWISTEYNNQSSPTEFSTLGIEEISSPTALSTFVYRKAITIDHTKVAGDLVNFPVLINLLADTSLAAHAQADTDDILFTSSSIAWNTGTVNDKLASEIESYNSTTGSLQAWVKIPSLSSTTDTVIYMYYGNGSVTSQQNKTAIWDGNTKMVQHMNQDPSGAAPQMIDSTQYGNNGYSSGTMLSNQSMTGKVGKGLSFDGSDDYIKTDNGYTNILRGDDTHTTTFWVKINAYDTWGTVLLDMEDQDAGYFIQYTNSGQIYVIAGGSGRLYPAPSNMIAGGFNKITFVKTGTGNSGNLYFNGILQSSYADTIASMPNVDSDMLFGKYHGGSDWNLNGVLDEINISNIVRSAQWIATEYNNQNNPTEFSSLGIEEVSSPATLASFGYRKAITIDHTKVAGDLTNFPVLINLPTDASLIAHAQADADDILFASSGVSWNTGTINDKLAAEIEVYNSTTGSLQAWVKIPNLSSTTDTVIYMYYGNGSVSSQQNKTAAWDSNTKLVQHLTETPANGVVGHMDSTQYKNNGTPQNFDNIATSTTNGTGQINGADVFDGTNDYIDNGISSSLDITNTVTVSAWIRPTAILPDEAVLVRKAANDCGNYNLQIKSHKLAFLSSNKCSWSYAGANSTIIDGVWQYVTVTADGSNLRYFINGSNTDTVASWSVGAVSNNTLTIGGYVSATAVDIFNGTIDEVRISNVARSSQWISTEYSNQNKPTEFSILGIEEISSPAALSSFGYRKAITIDHAKVVGDLVNFPMLINLPSDTSLAAHAQSDGDDILFTSNSIAWNTGTTNDRLAHEIETYTTATGSLQAWVKIPNLSSTVDTVIYMYYGNGSVTTQQNKTAVWDGNTKMVQHMNQNPGGTAPQMTDSTQFANNGTSGGAMTSGNSVAGQTDGATSFDGSNDYINAGNGNSLNVTNAITLSAWVKPSQNTTHASILAKEDYPNNKGYLLHQLSGTAWMFRLYNGTSYELSPASSVSLNQWQYVVGTYNGATMAIYKNGTSLGTGQGPTSIASAVDQSLGVGYRTTASQFFNGSIDEVRISNVARSASWITTEYNNQSNPTEFSSLGIEEVASPVALSSFGYRKSITIDHTKVAGNLANFPVLINLASDADLQARAQSDGDDILFAASGVAWDMGTVNDKLASEIESYNSTTGSLQAWVKIPSLSSTVDTVIYLYYGNSSITSQQNKTAIWDGNTKMVQHMNQTGAGQVGDYKDSTQYGNNSTNATNQPVVATGQVGNGQSFNGSSQNIDAGTGNANSLNITTNFTIGAWIKTTDTSSDTDHTIVGRGVFYDGVNNNGYIMFVYGGKLAVSFGGSGNLWVNYKSGPTVSDGNYHYVVSKWNGSNVLLYLDGTEYSAGSYSGTIVSSGRDAMIGSKFVASQYYTGSIDEVRISNTTRSAQWIATEYNNQSSPSTFYSVAGELVSTLAITGSNTQTAGNLQTVTLTAKDAAGNTMTGFSGDKSVTLAGAAASPNGANPTCRDKDGNDIAFGSAMTLTFASGVATCQMRLVKAEAASISSSNFATSTTPLAVTVSPNTLNNFLVEVPTSGNSGTAFASAITSRDYYNNVTTSIAGSTTISVSSGTIAPTSISASAFTDDGLWSGNFTITNITEQPSVVVTATNSVNTGTDTISILGIPQAPGSVSASRQSDTEFTVSWQDLSTVETNYDIERRTQTGGGWGGYAIIASASAGATSFVDNITNNPANPPQADRAYQYRVRAQNSIGYSSYGEDASIHYTTPNTPSGVFASHLSDTSFNLNYTDNAAVIDTHRLQRCSNANCSGTFETDLGVFSASPQADSAGISSNARYRWQARAEAPGGINSNYSQSNFEYTTPAAPNIGVVSVVSANSITVNWTDNSAYEDGFRLEVSIDGGAYTEITPGANTVGANISSYSFSSLGDHNYKFRLRAHVGATLANAELLSSYSADSSTIYTPSAAPTPETPVADSSTNIIWSWLDNSAFEESFRLHFIEGSHADVNDLAADSTSYASSGLLPNTKYQTHMHSYRSDTGESIASSPSAEIYTLANTPDNLTVTLSSQDHMTLNWGSNSNPDGTEYFLENMNTGDISDWITASSFTTGLLSCETEYSFRVKARNHDNAETAYSSTVTLMSSSCGAPLPPGAYNPPQAPTGDFSILINDGNQYTQDTKVKLTFFAGTDTTRMAISNSPDFSQASLVLYQKEAMWDLSDSVILSGAKNPATSQDITGSFAEAQDDRSADGTYTVYAKFYTKYGVASKVVSDSIILDMTAPDLNITNLKDKYLTTDSITLSGATESNSKVIYNLDSIRAGVIDISTDGKLTLNLGTLSLGTHSLKLIAQDQLGNSSETMQFYLIVEKPAITVPTVPIIPSTPISPKPTVPTDTDPITTPTPSIPSQSGTNVPDTDTSNIPDPTTGNPDLGADIVTPETPTSMQGGWNLLSIKPFPKDISTEDIQMIIDKFPEFKETFQNLGLTDFTNAEKLKNVSFNIPSLSEVMGLSPTDLTALNFPNVSTPVSQLSAQFKKEIPSNIVFVRTKDDNLDISSSLNFKDGNAGQKISLLAGKSFQLILRPDQDVDAVQGYLAFQGRQTAQVDDTLFRKAANLFGLDNSALADENVEERLVLSEFEYQDDDQDGIWTAEIQTPQVSGEYELITVMDYKDINLGSKTLRLITVVDPEGYVYEDIRGQELHIKNATVSIYRFNTETKKYELWDAGSYQQQNPQTTDERGTYSFLVPPGSYYLKAEAVGYATYQSDPFDVTVGSGVHINLKLIPIYDWKDSITWERLLLVVFGIGLFYNFYSDRRERRKMKVKEIV